jgi:hypothetical protein
VSLTGALVQARFRLARRRTAATRSPGAVRRAVGRAARADARGPRGLQPVEASRFSQNGEDGVIAEILRRIGATSRTCIEIGAADGSENCTRALVEAGFDATWIEGDPAAAEAARRVGNTTVIQAFVDRDNVVALLDGADREPDLLALDVDGNDWWVWRALGQAGFRPRAVVVEVNGQAGPWARWVMPYDPAHRWDGSAYYGASLRAWVALARDLGYVLVGCESTGVNAFFVRADLASRFDAPSVRDSFVAPQHPHPWSPPAPLPAAPIDRADGLQLQLDRVHGPARAGRPLHLTAWVANNSAVTVGAPGATPVHLAWRWGGDGEPARAHSLPWRAAPGERVLLPCRAHAPAAGEHVLRLALVQEGVRWLDPPGTLDVPITVTDSGFARSSHGYSSRES